MKYWPSYLLIAIVSTIVVNFTFALINRPKEKEVFNIFIASYGCENNSVKETLQRQENYPSEIRRFYVDSGILGTKQYQTKKKGLSYSMADLMVFPISQLNTLEKYSDFCHGFELDFVSNYFHIDDENNFIVEDAKIYGFKIYDATSKEGIFKEYIKYENDDINEDYYLIYKKTSLHLGKTKQNSKTDFALIIGRDFLNYEK